MVLTKKIKCLHCEETLECNNAVCTAKCGCGKVSLNNGIITEGVQGKDYIDISPKLLNE